MCSVLSCAIWLTALLHTPLVCSRDNCHTSLLHNNACHAFYLYLHSCYCNFIFLFYFVLIYFVLFCLFCIILFILYCLFYFIVLYCVLFYFILFYFVVCDYFFLTQYSKIYSQTASNPLQIHFHSSFDPLPILFQSFSILLSLLQSTLI